MIYFMDGDQLAIVTNDFVNLHESAALFLPLESDDATSILTTGSVDVNEMRMNCDHCALTGRINRLRNAINDACVEFGRLFIPLFERLLRCDRT